MDKHLGSLGALFLDQWSISVYHKNAKGGNRLNTEPAS